MFGVANVEKEDSSSSFSCRACSRHWRPHHCTLSRCVCHESFGSTHWRFHRAATCRSLFVAHVISASDFPVSARCSSWFFLITCPIIYSCRFRKPLRRNRVMLEVRGKIKNHEYEKSIIRITSFQRALFYWRDTFSNDRAREFSHSFTEAWLEWGGL